MKKLALVVLALTLSGCPVSDSSADEALREEGLHDPSYGGPSPWSCHDGDHFSRSFDAHRTTLDRDGHPQEIAVSGVICCGYLTCVVRVD